VTLSQAAAVVNEAGQSSAVPQHSPLAQQKPFWQWLPWHCASESQDDPGHFAQSHPFTFPQEFAQMTALPSTHSPSSLHVSQPVHVPQNPSQPLLPHTFSPHEGTQASWPSSLVPESVSP
jgi:hypothetical protein